MKKQVSLLLVFLFVMLALVSCGNTTPSSVTTTGTPTTTVAPHLQIPTVSVSEDGLASWNAVENAANYRYIIDGGEPKSTTKTSVQLSDGESISVMAVSGSDAFRDSEYSAPVTYHAPSVDPVKCLICGGDASVGAHGECPGCDGYLCDGNDHTHASTYCHVCGEALSIGSHEEMPCGHRACEPGEHYLCPSCQGYLCQGSHETLACGHSACQFGDHQPCTTCNGYLCQGAHDPRPCGHLHCQEGQHYGCGVCGNYLCYGDHTEMSCGHKQCASGDHSYCRFCDSYLCNGTDHSLMECGQHHACEGNVHHQCTGCGGYVCDGNDHIHIPADVCPCCGGSLVNEGTHECPHCDGYYCDGNDHNHTPVVEVCPFCNSALVGTTHECPLCNGYICDGNDHNHIPEEQICPICRNSMTEGAHGQCFVCNGFYCDGNDHTHAPVVEECPYCGSNILEGNHDLLECNHHACEDGYHHQCPGCMNFICHTSEEEHMPCDHCGNLLCQGSHDECRENACPACGTIGATHEILACGHYICEAADADHLECMGCGGYRCDGGDHYPCHVCYLPICQGDHAHEEVTSTCPGCGESGIVHELIIVDGSYLYSCQVSPDDYTCPGCGEAGIVHERLEDGSYSCQAGPDSENCPVCGGPGSEGEHWQMDCGHCYAVGGNHDRCGYCGNFFCYPDVDHSNCGAPIVGCPACGMTGDSHELLECNHRTCEEGNHTLCMYCQNYLCQGEHIACGKELCEGCGEMIVFPEDHAIAECGNHRICEGGDHYMIHCFHYICEPGDHGMLACGHHACWEGDHVYLPCGEHYACHYDNHEEHEIADCGHFGCAEGDHNPCEVCGGYVCEGDHGYANCWFNHRICDGQNHDRLDCDHFACEEGIHQYCESCGEGFICQGGHNIADCGHKECEGDRNHYILECGHFGCADGEHGVLCDYCQNILCKGDHTACFCPACGESIAGGNHFLYDCGHRACEEGIHVHCSRCGGSRCQGDHTDCNKIGCCTVCGDPYDDAEHGRRECGHCLSVAGDHDLCEICGYFLCHDLYDHSNCDKNQDENCPVCGGTLSQGNHAQCPDCDGHFCDGNDHNHTPAVEICPGCGEEGVTHSRYTCDHYVCEEGSHGACLSCGQFICQSGMEHGIRPCGNHRYCEAVDIAHEWCEACDSGYICDGGHTEQECGHRVCEEGDHAPCRYCGEGYICQGNHGFCESCGNVLCQGNHQLYSCGIHSACQYEPNENGECPICSDPCFSGHSYEEKVIPPSCISTGITKLVCSVCGDTQILSQTAPNGVHSYGDDGKCTVCGQANESIEYFTYTEREDGTYSIGINDKTVYSEHMVIPSDYNGRPVTAIADEGFYGTGMTTITIPDSVVHIGNNAFQNCNNLENIAIPDSVVTIGDKAFSGCKYTEIYIPAGVTSIGTYVFSNSVTFINVNPNNPVYTSIDGNLYSKDGTILYQYALGNKNTAFAVPSHVLEIGKGAFANNKYLQTIIVSEGVVTIGYGAFQNGTALQEVVISSTVTYIGDMAFFYSRQLRSVVIGAGVTYIGYQAFRATGDYLAGNQGITFVCTDGWHVTADAEAAQSQAGGEAVDVADVYMNVENLQTTYKDYYWYRAD